MPYLQNESQFVQYVLFSSPKPRSPTQIDLESARSIRRSILSSLNSKRNFSDMVFLLLLFTAAFYRVYWTNLHKYYAYFVDETLPRIHWTWQISFCPHFKIHKTVCCFVSDVYHLVEFWSAKIGVISVLNWFQWTPWGNFISRIRFIHLNSHKIMSITAVFHTRTYFYASFTSNLITFNWLLNYLLNLCFPPLATLNVNTARKRFAHRFANYVMFVIANMPNHLIFVANFNYAIFFSCFKDSIFFPFQRVKSLGFLRRKQKKYAEGIAWVRNVKKMKLNKISWWIDVWEHCMCKYFLKEQIW